MFWLSQDTMVKIQEIRSLLPVMFGGALIVIGSVSMLLPEGNGMRDMGPMLLEFGVGFTASVIKATKKRVWRKDFVGGDKDADKEYKI